MYTLSSLDVLSQAMIHSGLCTLHGHAIKYAQTNRDENMNKVLDLHNLELNMRQAGFLKIFHNSDIVVPDKYVDLITETALNQ